MSEDVRLSARGLLFDNDGVLVDSESSVVRSWSRWAVEIRRASCRERV